MYVTKKKLNAIAIVTHKDKVEDIERVVTRAGEKFVSEGTYKSYDNTVLLAGACNVGKSSLASVFIGHEIPKEWRSTDGLMIYFGQNGIDLSLKKMVPFREDFNIFSKVLRGSPDVIQTGSSEESNGGQTSRRHDNSMHEYGAPSSFSSDAARQKPFTELEIECYRLTDDFVKGLKDGTYTVDIAPSDLVDFGGQRSFDMTHQLFIRQNGAFVVMFDGRYGFLQPLPEYKKLGMTNEDIVKHWVNSILTYCIDGESTMPMITFAATHSDNFSKEVQNSKKDEFLGYLNAYFGEHPLKEHIVLDTMFFVNARNPYDSEIKRLQVRLVKIAMNQPSWGTRRPVRWVPLEMQIAQMKKNKSFIVEKEDLRKINIANGDLSLSEKQFEEFLVGQHSAGKILYFNQPVLDEYVVLHPPALVNILKSIITDKMFWPKLSKFEKIMTKVFRNKRENVQKERIRVILKGMNKTGRISKLDLQKIWNQPSVPIETTDIGDFVIELLVHLDVIIRPRLYRDIGGDASGKSDSFLVPCVIKDKLNMSFLEEESFNGRTISLVFTMKRAAIPSALAYKLIGAVCSIWPFKEEAGRILLFHYAAVLSVDSEHEMIIFVQENEVITFLTHSKSKYQISADVAASIKECLVHTLDNVLQFYNSSLGGRNEGFTASQLFDTKIGEICNKQPCVVTFGETTDRSEWTCRHGNRHEAETALKWTFDKHLQNCLPSCTGPNDMILQQRCDDVLLIRLASQLGMSSFRELMINLGLQSKDLDNLQYEYTRPLILIFMGLKMWRDNMTKPGSYPCFKNIQAALLAISDKDHHLCQVFRNSLQLEHIASFDLQRDPDDYVLGELARNMGNCTVHLGIELGLGIPSIEETLHKYQKDMYGQTRDILMKWKAKNSHIKPTIFRLMEAVNRVDRGGLMFLTEKYITRKGI